MPDTILELLQRDGFVVLENFLSDEESNELRAAGLELARGIPESERKMVFSTQEDKTQHKHEYFLNSNDKIRYFFERGALEVNGKLKVCADVSLNKVGHALHLLHPLFRCYTYSDRVKSVCRQLGLAEPAVVQSMYIYKNPGVGSEVVGHQDSSYLYSEPIPAIGFWIALEDATLGNGCLWIARGSHSNGVHRRLRRNPEKEGDPLVYDHPQQIYPHSRFTPVPVRKGTCILLHGNVVHKSAHNRSDQSRHAYTFHAVERRNNQYSAENWLQEGPNAPFLNIYTTPQIADEED